MNKVKKEKEIKFKNEELDEECIDFKNINYTALKTCPICYWCGGEMTFYKKQEKVKRDEFGDTKKVDQIIYRCTTPFCRARTIREVDLETLNKHMDEEAEAREKGMIKKKGGSNRSGRHRQKKEGINRRKFWEKW